MKTFIIKTIVIKFYEKSVLLAFITSVTKQFETQFWWKWGRGTWRARYVTGYFRVNIYVHESCAGLALWRKTSLRKPL